jgi:polyisoprenoid-binding protein YceI
MIGDRLQIPNGATLKLAAFSVFCALVLSQRAVAQDTVLQLDPATTSVNFTLSDVLHTVHGTFRLKSGTIHFDPSSGAARGDVVIDAASGDSGNRMRDKKMNKDILETQRYPTIEFLPKHFTGKVALQGESQVQVEGTFRLHGSDHDLTLTFPIQVTAQQLSTSTHFEVPYEAWGLKNPSTLFLRVNNKVQIDITTGGTIETASH